MFNFVIGIIKFTIPFIKEMIIGKNSWRYAIRRNKIKIIFFLLVILSFILNWVTIPRIVILSTDYLQLQKENKVLLEAPKKCMNDLADLQHSHLVIKELKDKIKSLEARQSEENPIPSNEHKKDSKKKALRKDNDSSQSKEHDIEDISKKLVGESK